MGISEEVRDMYKGYFVEEKILNAFELFTQTIKDSKPKSRCMSLTMTKLEECFMWYQRS